MCNVDNKIAKHAVKSGVHDSGASMIRTPLGPDPTMLTMVVHVLMLDVRHYNVYNYISIQRYAVQCEHAITYIH